MPLITRQPGLTGYLIWIVLLKGTMVYADTVGPSPHDHPPEETHNESTYGRPATSEKPDRVIEVTASDIDFKPASISVTRGETIRFVVSNRGKLMHEFVLGTQDEQHRHHADMSKMSAEAMRDHMEGLANGIMVPPGETRELTWVFDTTTEQLQYSCNVPGHYEAGMYGPLHIGHD